ncbi:MAG: DUF4143 domain-containing protein [Methanocorpusculum sp.]|nr:DUF4143 domain-containing protein [Methanocorpusculum sp.]
MEKYRPRIADTLLKDRLEGKGAILVEGAKWCGKTTTSLHQSASVLYMQDPDAREQNMRLAGVKPSALLEGKVPRLIDEWQTAPQLWDAVRFEVDKRDAFGQFILTGSVTPGDTSQILHSGTGRIGRIRMRPMSLFESGESNGSVRLSSLFAGDSDVNGTCDISLEETAFLICRGGWPKSIGCSRRVALQQAADYYDSVVYADISGADGIRKDPERVKRFMRSYARAVAAQTKIPTLIEDISANEGIPISEVTVHSYIDALKKIFVIEDAPAWNPNLRSKTAVRTSDTRYYTDPSIGAAALGLSPGDLIGDLRTMGLFFENLCIRDLRVYADAMGGTVYHYRDKNGLECDAVIHLRDGSYGLAEIKLGGESAVREGISTLNALESLIDTSKMKAPAFKMVITGTGRYAYRDDGVFIVPAGCLRN